MTIPVNISVDAMGADSGPSIAVDGIEVILKRKPGTKARFLLHGDESVLGPLVAAKPAEVRHAIDIRHSATEVRMTDKPSEAVRRSRGSSMWNALVSVKEGEAAVVVSAGNTGALMAISKVVLRMKKGVHRPAIAASWPTVKGHTVVLDVGANVECSAAQLVEFAIMGEAYHRAVHGSDNPSVGLLNVGQEELKGNDTVRAAAALIRDAHIKLNYYGFVEGDDISMGVTDVVVTDGFSGNIALKTAEGAVKLVAAWMRESFSNSLSARLGAALLSISGIKELRTRLDPRSINGGVLLGLNGMVVKSHGGTDGEGFATALGIAIDIAPSNFLSQIEGNLERLAHAEELEAAREPAE